MLAIDDTYRNNPFIHIYYGLGQVHFPNLLFGYVRHLCSLHGHCTSKFWKSSDKRPIRYFGEMKICIFLTIFSLPWLRMTKYVTKVIMSLQRDHFCNFWCIECVWQKHIKRFMVHSEKYHPQQKNLMQRVNLKNSGFSSLSYMSDLGANLE